MRLDRLARIDSADHSPCVGHCTYDDQDFCLSCRRSTAEISAWRDADAPLREAAWQRIPDAIDAADVGVMRLPLSPDDISALAIETLDEGGAWCVGGAGHWLYAHDLTRDEDGILTAVSDDGCVSINLDLSGKMRALAWARGGKTLSDDLDDLPILIVVPRARVKTPPMTETTTRDDGLIDLGHGITGTTLLQDGDDLMIETLLATARVIKGASHLPISGDAAVPHDLDLPESYLLAAVLLPKGQERLK